MVDFQCFMNNCVELARKTYADNEMDGVTLFFLESRDSEKNALWAIPMPEGNAKVLAYDMLCKCFKNRDAIRYGVMSRAWKGGNVDIRPSDDPDRAEIMVVASASISGEKICRVFDIKADNNGAVISMAEDGELMDTEINGGGAMLTILDRKCQVAINPSAAEMMLSGFLISGTIPSDHRNKALLN